MMNDRPDLEPRMASIRRQAGTVGFSAGFTDRVLARLAAPRSLADGLQRGFLRLAPFAAAAAMLLGAVNLIASRASGQPLVERVLGLPAVTLAAAYSLESTSGWEESPR